MRLLVFLAALAFACAARSAHLDLPPPEEPDDPLAELSPDAAPRLVPPVAAPAANPLTRSELQSVLSLGPSAFLQGIRVKPTFLGKRWGGWEIVSFWPDDPRFGAVDLRPGDVVESVNGMRLERPEELWELWDSLTRVPSLNVTYVRRGVPRTLSFPIAD